MLSSDEETPVPMSIPIPLTVMIGCVSDRVCARGGEGKGWSCSGRVGDINRVCLFRVSSSISPVLEFFLLGETRPLSFLVFGREDDEDRAFTVTSSSAGNSA